MSCDNLDCKNTVVYEETCDRCKLQLYCSPDCSRKDWFSSHKFVCPSVNSLKLADFDTKSSKLLGRGGVGEAFLVRHKLSSRLYVMKRIQKSKSNISLIRQREIDVHKHLRHPNIIRLYGHFEDSKYVYLVLEYAENGSLFSYIKKFDSKISEKMAWHFFTQIVLGLFYLHKNNIIHRDLKPENVLVDRNLNIKICDFGACVKSNEDTRKTYVGTLQFMPPEMVNGSGHSFEVDNWAIGIILYELLHGFTPFVSNTQRRTRAMIREVQFNVDSCVSDEATDLLKALIRRNPADRLKLNAVLGHPWVKKYLPRNEYEVGQAVTCQKLGDGHIEKIEGLICTLNFNGVSVHVPTPDLIKQFEVENCFDFPSFSKSDHEELEDIEDKLLEKLDKICQKSTTKKPTCSIEVDFNEHGGGIMDNKRLDSVKKFKIMRNPVGLPPPKAKRSISMICYNSETTVDLSEETMQLRIQELERISCNLQKKSQEPIVNRRNAPKRRSLFSFLFGCQER